MDYAKLTELIEKHNVYSADSKVSNAAWSALKKEYDQICTGHGLTERKLKTEWEKYKKDNVDRMKKFNSPSREPQASDRKEAVKRKPSIAAGQRSARNRTSDRPTVEEEKSALMNSEVSLVFGPKSPGRKPAAPKSPARWTERYVKRSPPRDTDDGRNASRSRTRSALKVTPKGDETPPPTLELIRSPRREVTPPPVLRKPSKREETPPPILTRMRSSSAKKRTSAKDRLSEVEPSNKVTDMTPSPSRNPMRSCRVDRHSSLGSVHPYLIDNPTPEKYLTSSELMLAQLDGQTATSHPATRSASSTSLKRGRGRPAGSGVSPSPKKSPSHPNAVDSTPRKRGGRAARGQLLDAFLTQRVNFGDDSNLLLFDNSSPFKIGRLVVDLAGVRLSDFNVMQQALETGGLLDEDEILEGRVSASPNPERRQQSRLLRQRSALDDAKLRLHTSEIPDKLIKREAEYKEIYDFIMNGVTRRESQALYISGVPGTGKTATVMKVIEHLKMTKKADFRFVAVNALELSNPKRLFCVIYKEFTKNSKSISPTNAQQRLNDMFSTIDKKRLPLVLLLDEVDMLYTKRQEVVYTVFNWSVTEGSKVSVIAISNTLDLPERILAPRVASRLGSKRLCFQPYDFKELIEIIQHRISNCEAISKDAVEFAARKVRYFGQDLSICYRRALNSSVGALSGDLRKALELLRRAIDVAVEECEEKGGDLSKVQMTLAHVNTAIQESVRSMRMDYCHTMSADEERLFRSLVNDLKRSNMEETTFYRLLMEYKDLCNAEAEDPLSSSIVFRILMNMAGIEIGKQIRFSSNFLSLSADAGQMSRRIMLNLSLSEAQFCIRQMDERKNNLIKNPTAIKTV